MPNLPRQTTDGPKHLTPPAPKPKPPKPPCVREGDVLLVRDRYIYHGGRPAVVVRVASGRSGSHKVICGDGQEMDIAKQPQIRPGVPNSDMITIIGHDAEWLRAEQRIVSDRIKFVRPHAAAAISKIREERSTPR